MQKFTHNNRFFFLFLLRKINNRYLLVSRVVRIRIIAESRVSVNDRIGPRATEWEGIAYHRPLRFVIKCHYLIALEKNYNMYFGAFFGAHKKNADLSQIVN